MLACADSPLCPKRDLRRRVATLRFQFLLSSFFRSLPLSAVLLVAYPPSRYPLTLPFLVATRPTNLSTQASSRCPRVLVITCSDSLFPGPPSSRCTTRARCRKKSPSCRSPSRRRDHTTRPLPPRTHLLRSKPGPVRPTLAQSHRRIPPRLPTSLRCHFSATNLPSPSRGGRTGRGNKASRLSRGPPRTSPHFLTASVHRDRVRNDHAGPTDSMGEE